MSLRGVDPDALVACTACPRLAAYLAEARALHPDWVNLPVLPWGDPDARILIVGFAPGYKGANRTGRPFCGDVSGAWVYAALHRRGWAASPDPAAPGQRLVGIRITNAVKCVPPQNRPTPEEVRSCRTRWLMPELAEDRAPVMIAFGAVAHQAVVDAAGARRAAHPFAHGAEHALVVGGTPRVLLDSFHPSPHNTYTGRMTLEMFDAVFARADALASAAGPGMVRACPGS